jgi:proteasome lid subunit RPN8/RPN11
VADEMVRHAQEERPRECCGLLAGERLEGMGRVKRLFRLVNALASGVEYESEPASMLRAMKAIDAEGLEVLAVYHSHPTSPPVPSRKDLERNPYEDWAAHAIISLAGQVPEVRFWWLGESTYREAEWVVEGPSPAGGAS